MVKHNIHHRQNAITHDYTFSCNQLSKSTLKAKNNSNGILKMNQLRKIEVGLGKSMQCRKPQ